MFGISTGSSDPFSEFANSGSVVSSGGLPAVNSGGTDYLSRFLDVALKIQSDKTANDIRESQFEQERLLKQIEVDSNVNAQLFDLQLADLKPTGNQALIAGAVVLALAGVVWAVVTVSK